MSTAKPSFGLTPRAKEEVLRLLAEHCAEAAGQAAFTPEQLRDFLRAKGVTISPRTLLRFLTQETLPEQVRLEWVGAGPNRRLHQIVCNRPPPPPLPPCETDVFTLEDFDETTPGHKIGIVDGDKRHCFELKDFLKMYTAPDQIKVNESAAGVYDMVLARISLHSGGFRYVHFDDLRPIFDAGETTAIGITNYRLVKVEGVRTHKIWSYYYLQDIATDVATNGRWTLADGTSADHGQAASDPVYHLVPFSAGEAELPPPAATDLQPCMWSFGLNLLRHYDATHTYCMVGQPREGASFDFTLARRSEIPQSGTVAYLAALEGPGVVQGLECLGQYQAPFAMMPFPTEVSTCHWRVWKNMVLETLGRIPEFRSVLGYPVRQTVFTMRYALFMMHDGVHKAVEEFPPAIFTATHSVEGGCPFQINRIARANRLSMECHFTFSRRVDNDALGNVAQAGPPVGGRCRGRCTGGLPPGEAPPSPEGPPSPPGGPPTLSATFVVSRAVVVRNREDEADAARRILHSAAVMVANEDMDFAGRLVRVVEVNMNALLNKDFAFAVSLCILAVLADPSALGGRPAAPEVQVGDNLVYCLRAMHAHRQRAFVPAFLFWLRALQKNGVLARVQEAVAGGNLLTNASGEEEAKHCAIVLGLTCPPVSAPERNVLQQRARLLRDEAYTGGKRLALLTQALKVTRNLAAFPAAAEAAAKTMQSIFVTLPSEASAARVREEGERVVNTLDLLGEYGADVASLRDSVEAVLAAAGYFGAEEAKEAE